MRALMALHTVARLRPVLISICLIETTPLIFATALYITPKTSFSAPLNPISDEKN